MLIIFLLHVYVPKRYFSDANVGKLEESSRTTLPFRRVCLWRHNHFTREIGRVACHPPPCGWQAGHSGQIVWKTLWIWEKSLSLIRFQSWLFHYRDVYRKELKHWIPYSLYLYSICFCFIKIAMWTGVFLWEIFSISFLHKVAFYSLLFYDTLWIP